MNPAHHPVAPSPAAAASISLASPDSPDALARDVAAVSRISAVPSMLQMVCDETGMGFAAVARVTDATWTACAVQDRVGFGLQPGGQLELRTTLCFESRASRTPVIIDNVSEDAAYCGHHTPAMYGLQSYISVPIVLPNGDYFGNLCAIDAKPAKVSEPRVVRMFEVFADLIAMQVDNELRQWSTEAQLTRERETAALREQFIAVLGHDLRNPLSAINATADLLMFRKSDPFLVSSGERLRRAVHRMKGLIDDVMDFARGRLGGGIALSLAPIDTLGAHLHAVVDELKVANPARVIACEIAVAGPVYADRARLEQLLSNLLANALVHGAQDLPVTVVARLDGEYVTIAVTNGGKPIPEHLLPNLFEPYWRPASSEPGGGLGLGLYICSQIVQAHRGTLEVRSCHGHGTTFTARIPSCAAVADAIAS